METGMLHLHSLLRWVILLLLLVGLFQAFSKKDSIKSTSLWLMIAAHTMLLIGLYQWIAGRYGILKGLPESVPSLMKDSFYRFYWVEHPLLMLVAIILITLARGKAKKLNYKNTGWLLLIALIFILVAVPWPFRDVATIGAGRHWFPGM
jgi:glucan phosphoethanolaminetransferase (alkaline phosphatase superfamily)